MASIWFGDNERSVAIGLIAFSFALGSIVGLTLGPMFVYEEDKDDPEKIKEQAVEFMRYVSLATTVLCFPMLLFYK